MEQPPSAQPEHGTPDPASIPLKFSEAAPCPKCGYSLENMSRDGVCPECGQRYTWEVVGVLEPRPPQWKLVLDVGWPIFLSVLLASFTLFDVVFLGRSARFLPQLIVCVIPPCILLSLILPILRLDERARRHLPHFLRRRGLFHRWFALGMLPGILGISSVVGWISLGTILLFLILAGILS